MVGMWAKLFLFGGMLALAGAAGPARAGDPARAKMLPDGVLAAADPDRPGFQVLTRADDASIADHLVVVRYRGLIEAPMAAQLREIWSTLRGTHSTIVLQLDSPGGELGHAEAVVSILKEIRREATLKTLVLQGEKCLSACIAVFVQGVERIAGGATAWMIHGACPADGNVPLAEPTRRYVDLLREAGVSAEFLCSLDRQGYVERPGAFWASGYELVHVHHANIISWLLDPWQPETVRQPRIDPQIRSR